VFVSRSLNSGEYGNVTPARTLSRSSISLPPTLRLRIACAAMKYDPASSARISAS
jgi:hypothetical protein